VGDRPSTKPGDNSAMVKSIAAICGIDAMTFSTLSSYAWFAHQWSLVGTAVNKKQSCFK
jgi:hypothetical protein